jgi:predicted secreted Zn-dependent protease
MDRLTIGQDCAEMRNEFAASGRGSKTPSPTPKIPLGQGREKAMISRSSLEPLIAGILACLLTPTSAVVARPFATTHYEYYSVSGMSAASLHRSLEVHGPQVGGYKAYAATSMDGHQSGALVQTPAGCALANYQLKLTFTMRLPRLAAGSAMNPDLRAKWESFEKFVRAHEGVHRSIWMSCAAATEAKVRAIRAGSCEAAQARATGIMNDMWSQCAKRHDVFDAAQRNPLMRQPFIVAANATPHRFISDGSRVRAARGVHVGPRLGM